MDSPTPQPIASFPTLEEKIPEGAASTNDLPGNAVAITTPEPVKEFTDLIEELEKSVVRLDVETKNGGGVGSGFVIDQDGTVITNFHVVEGAKKITAIFPNGTKAKVPGYRLLDSRKDLAIIKIDLEPNQLFPLEMASNFPRKGSKVIALGSPSGLSFSATDGLVSGIRGRDELKGINLKATLIQTTAPISPGNSGGPLVDFHGKVVGVNTLASNSSKIQNINFAVSARDLRDSLDGCDMSVIPW